MNEPANPVIVVPGITATGLRDEYPVNAERVWTPTTRAGGDFRRVILHPLDPREEDEIGLPLYEAAEPSRVVPDEVFGLVYRELIESLRHELAGDWRGPVPVYAFPYDWRRPLAEIQAAFADFVQEVLDRTSLMPGWRGGSVWSGDPRVDLVGHSMGGLIIAGYLADWRGECQVGRVVTLGTPFRGSVEALLKLATGEGSVGGERVAQRERELARLMPSMYHLLPDYEGVLRDERGRAMSCFDRSSMQRSTLSSIETALERLLPDEFAGRSGPRRDRREAAATASLDRMLASAKAHRAAANAPGLLEEAGLEPTDWLCVVGLGDPTRVEARASRGDGWCRYDVASMDKRNEWTGDSPALREHTGDGTVPLLGALPGFLPRERVVCVTDDDIPWFAGAADRLLEAGIGLHGSLPVMGMVQRLVVSHLRLTDGVRGKPFGRVWGRRAPNVADGAWTPPIEGLEER